MVVSTWWIVFFCPVKFRAKPLITCQAIRAKGRQTEWQRRKHSFLGGSNNLILCTQPPQTLMNMMHQPINQCFAESCGLDFIFDLNVNEYHQPMHQYFAESCDLLDFIFHLNVNQYHQPMHQNFAESCDLLDFIFDLNVNEYHQPINQYFAESCGLLVDFIFDLNVNEYHQRINQYVCRILWSSD